MTFVCDSCGKVHGEMSPYFKWRRPIISFTAFTRLRYDNEYMCRIGHKRHFISCELEIPFKEKERQPLGFIGWVEVSREDYDSYLAYRLDERAPTRYPHLIEGKLANAIPAVENSLGTPVKFKVIKRDPTPYIKWVAPKTAVAQRLKQRATDEFWHEACGIVPS